jgi:hypothetical protein
MRRPLVPPAILHATNALALRGGEWFEVTGGSWEPDSKVLSIAKRRLHEQWLTRFRGDPELYETWLDCYCFQFQGFTAKDGRRLVHVNAFFADVVETLHGEFDYSQVWVRPFRGAHFFRAAFDPMTNAVTTFEVFGSE